MDAPVNTVAENMPKRAEGAVLISVAALLLVAAPVLACFSQADLCAVEVVLSKPGVSYDLSKLNVEQVEPGVYAYRSPADSRLLVLISEQRLRPESGEKFLAVRVQVPLRRVLVHKLGWQASCSEKLVYGPVELELNSGIGEASLDLGVLNLTEAAILMFKPVLEASGASKLSAGGVLELHGEKDSYRINTPCIAAFDKECVRIAVIIPGYDVPMEVEAGTYTVKAVVSWASSSSVKGEFRVHVLSCPPKPQEDIEETVAPAYNVSHDELAAVLRAELEWLTRAGVVSGLSSEDVEAITGAAHVGYAGWNSRLIWWDGGWRPYYEAGVAVLVRCVAAPPQVMNLEAVELIPYRAESGGTAVAQNLIPLYVSAAVALTAALIVAAALLRRYW